MPKSQTATPGTGLPSALPVMARISPFATVAAVALAVTNGRWVTTDVDAYWVPPRLSRLFGLETA